MFDAATSEIPVDTPALELSKLRYQQRREQAAALWRRVPQKEFNMCSWSCGSRACALGWLAHKRLNGWRWHQRHGAKRPIHLHHCGELFDPWATYCQAARHFGLTDREATTLFGGNFRTACFYGKPDDGIDYVTPADVADKLLQMPITVYE